jgi:hypothetical protein
MKLASRSAMLSLSSAKAGSSAARGSEVLPDRGPDGVVCEARRDVREGGRRGVVGREAAEGLRECDGVAMAMWRCLEFASQWASGRCDFAVLFVVVGLSAIASSRLRSS